MERTVAFAGEEAVLGWLSADTMALPWTDAEVARALGRIGEPFYAVALNGGLGFATGLPAASGGIDSLPFLACVPPCPIERLGDPAFRRAHGVQFAYYAGSMANGIASVALAEALGKAGFLGFFGAAGLPADAVEKAIDELEARLDGLPYGCNLIHSPNEPDLEREVADLYIRRGVKLVEASAYLDLTLPIVKYRVHGIYRDVSGIIVTPNRVIAKCSRIEVASKFLAPPPAKFLEPLVASGAITPTQAELAGQIPMAQDLTAEADSGGHTDRRPAITLLPTMLALAEQMQAKYRYAEPLRVGLGGGISTPASAAAAFAMGAAYVVTGSVNQACTESGSSDLVRQMLAETTQADITMAPAADMFEMGVEVQVVKRGTMFPMRGAKLYELYRKYPRLEEIPADEREKLEKTVFRMPFGAVWEQTKAFFLRRDPKQIARAEQDPKHKMALVFRAYLGQASGWANQGLPERKIDYQIWCGPSMGAFNEWVRGSFLDAPGNRQAVTVAKNILYGAAVMTRCAALRNQGIPVPADATRVVPYPLDQLEEEWL